MNSSNSADRLASNLCTPSQNTAGQVPPSQKQVAAHRTRQSSAETVAKPLHTFASDNYAGAHPEVLAALVAANIGHAPAYGADAWTARFSQVAQSLFGPQTESFPVFNGTGANVLALQSALPRWGAVVAARSAHINSDEGGAPERVAGIKILTVDTPDGKLTPSLIDQEAWGWGDEHRAQPLAISISNSTEFGTVYSPEEIRLIAEHAHERGMLLHLDGSRLGNAAASLGCTLAALTSEAGVDVLSLGGTKNGLLGAEAVLALQPQSLAGIKYLRKTNMQLGSKMRFISAQLLALYEGDLWLRSAQHANLMAARLRTGLEQIARTDHALVLPLATEANVVFAELSESAKARAHQQAYFYDWPGSEQLVRLMCSFDTQAHHVDELLAAIGDETLLV